MSLRRTTLHENARSALECGPPRRAALKSEQKAVADATALQGAFGTAIFMAAKDRRSCYFGWRGTYKLQRCFATLSVTRRVEFTALSI
jgi:hypothetical protein